MKYYIINRRDNKMDDYQSSHVEVMTIFISMMTMMMMMPKASLECSISNLLFFFFFRCLKN